MTSSEKFEAKNDKYLSSKILGAVLPPLCGSKGTELLKIYHFFRQVDDLVDENSRLSVTDKTRFLDEQIKAIRGEPTDPVSQPGQLEITPADIRWGLLEENTVKRQCVTMLSAMRNEVQHPDLLPRLPSEIRLNNRQVLLSAIEMVALTVNGKDPKVTPKFTRFLDLWNQLSDLSFMDEDLSFGVCKIPLNAAERKQVVSASTVSERERLIRQIITPERFYKQKRRLLLAVAKSSPSYFELDIPAWQKVSCFLYMGEVIAKKALRMRHPDSKDPAN